MTWSPLPTPAEPGDIDPRFLAAHGIVPVTAADADGRLVVAMPDPTNTDLIAALAFAARRPVVAHALSPDDAGDGAGDAASGGVGAAVSASPSLAARIVAALDGSRRLDWLAVEMVAQLVADGATAGEAVRRVMAVMPSRTVSLDRIVAGAPAAAMLPAVAAAMRCDVTCAAALRQALAVPVLAMILAGVTLGGWGFALLLPAWPLWAAASAATAARRTARGLVAGGDAAAGAVLTPAERDRIETHGMASLDATAVATVIAAVESRTLLAIRDAGGRAAMTVVLILAILSLVRLG